MTSSASSITLTDSNSPWQCRPLRCPYFGWACRGVVVFCSVLLAAPLHGQESDIRTWTDATGKFTIEAKLVGVENGKARLEKTDGKTIQIELEKLSKSDQAFVANLMGESSSGAGAPGAKKGMIDNDDITIVEVDRTPRWSMAIQPRPLATDWSTDPIPLSIPENDRPGGGSSDDTKRESNDDAGETDSGETDSDRPRSGTYVRLPDVFAVGNQNSPNWLLYRRNFFMQREGGPYNGVALDLSSNGTASPFTAIPASEIAMAVDPTNTVMACVSESLRAGANGHRLFVFEVRGNKISERSWMEIADTTGFGVFWRTPEVQFAGPSHLLVTTPYEYDALTGCCDLGEATMNWAVRHPWGAHPLVTPDNKSIVISFDGGIASFDRSSGEQTGWIDTGRTSFEGLCLTPDGQRLVASSRDRVAVFGMTDGVMESCFGIYSRWNAAMSPRKTVEVYPVGDSRVATLISEKASTVVVLSDIDLRCTVCSYSFPRNSNCTIDGMGKLRFLDADDTGAIWNCMSLPHDEVAADIEASLEKVASLSLPSSVAVEGRYTMRKTTYFYLGNDARGNNRTKYRFDELIDFTEEVQTWMKEHGMNPGGSGGVVFTLEESSPRDPDKENPAGRGGNSIRPPTTTARPPQNKGGSQAAGDLGSSRPNPEREEARLMEYIPDNAEITGHAYALGSRIGTLHAGALPVWEPCQRYHIPLIGTEKANGGRETDLSVEEYVERVLGELDIPAELNYPAELFHFRLERMGDRGFRRFYEEEDQQ